MSYTQGYLAHQKTPRRRTLQQPYAQGPMVILAGWVFLMSEVPLYLGVSHGAGWRGVSREEEEHGGLVPVYHKSKQ